MSDSEPSHVYMFNNSDPEMQRAYEKARSTFRYFWREVAWERRRIIPGLDLAAVKAPFSDDKTTARIEDAPDVEHMWLSEIDFDGQVVSGVLLNSPNELKSVKEGDAAHVPLNQISDWMFAIEGNVYGAYSVNLMRSRMNRQERRQHDDAWGLNFGDPSKIRIAPDPNQGVGFLKRWFGKKEPSTDEHPMCEGMAKMLREQIQAEPSLVHERADNGWTFLHQEALAGNLATVTALLEEGADKNAVTDHGMTPIQLAKCLGWTKVIEVLSRK